MIFINTDKGRLVLPSEEIVKYDKSDYSTALKYNRVCKVSVSPNSKRDLFFLKLKTTESVTQLIEKTLKPPFMQLCIINTKLLIRRLMKLEWGR